MAWDQVMSITQQQWRGLTYLKSSENSADMDSKHKYNDEHTANKVILQTLNLKAAEKKKGFDLSVGAH